ncbi:MAG: hypothetical protein V4604_17985 [Bacteroidota bacterium]
MSQVTLGHIEAAIKKVDTLDDSAIDRLTETHTTAQPVLLGYVMSASEEYQNEDLESLLVYYFTVILEAFSQAELHPATVSESQIDDFEEPYFALLDNYFETEDDQLLEDFSDQPDLVRFMALEVSMEDEDGATLDDETATQLFIVSLAMISLLSRSINQ